MPGARVDGRDGSLELIGPGLHVAPRLVEERKAFVDRPARPARAVLGLEQGARSLRVEPSRGPRVLEQEQRREPQQLGIAREEPQQEAREPDRLLAERRANESVTARRRVALVEEQVDHRGDRADALWALGRA